jgi:serine/threonine protein kinase/tetratricopeptide (TPR) repeat protein
MGIVYKAYDPELERAVALKLLHGVVGTESSPSGGRRDRLLREAKALARLAHPNVLAVFDVGTFQNDVFLATEFVEGPTLSDWMEAPGRTRPEILRALIDAGEGLAAAHRAGLVHRDFKPSNVMVGNDGRVRVLDFGLARAESHDQPIRALAMEAKGLGSSTTTGAAARVLVKGKQDEPTVRERRSVSLTGARKKAEAELAKQQRESDAKGAVPSEPRLVEGTSAEAPPSNPSLRSPSLNSAGLLDLTITQAGQILGTPRFMAPEQHEGKTADARSDQFSFCVSLYAALYGEFPFAGKGEDYSTNLMRGQVRSAPAGAEVPKWLRAVVLRGLSLSMDELLAELRRDPGAVRRRWLAIGGGFVALLGVGLALRSARPAPEPPCRGAEKKLAGVWDDERRGAVQAAFTRAGGAAADDTFQRAGRALDEYAKGWVAMHTDACEATQVRGEQSAETLDLRVGCLGERLEDLRAQVDVFAHADGGTVDKAVQAARALPRLATCADAAALRAPIRPPADAATKARVDGVRAEVAKAKAHQRAGDYGEASRLASQAATEATSIGYRPLEAEALFELGDVQDDEGEYATAEHTLRLSVAAALAGKHELQAARGLIALVSEVGLRQVRFAEAHEWALLAAGATERTSEPFIKGELARNVGRVFFREARYEDARQSLEKCLAIWEPVLGKEDDAVAGALTDLANVQVETGKTDEAILAYNRSLAIQEKAFGPDNVALAPNIHNLGEIYLTRGEYDLAEPAILRARALWSKALGEEHPKMALVFYNLSRIRLGRGDLDGAGELAARALAIWKKVNAANAANAKIGEETAPDPEVALGLHGVAVVRRAKKDFKGALAAESEALTIREKVFGLDDTDVADSLSSLGQTRVAMGDTRAAVPLFERALKIDEADGEDAMAIGDARFDLAQAIAHTDPARASELAKNAGEAYAKVSGPRAKERGTEVEAWMGANR